MLSSLFPRISVTVLSLILSTYALPTISRKGSKLFTSDDKQFFFKGVAYQNTGADSLMDSDQCARDIPLMKQLGVNAIRVYHVFPSANHDGCMQQLEEAGIYAFIDLDTWASEPTEFDTIWSPAQLGAYMYVMDAFINYDNLGGFFVGNEIINQAGNATRAAPMLKAMVGDLKAYRDAMGYRPAPIGYSHADVAGLDQVLRNYLTCGKEATQIEFFGLNSYRWCGQETSYDVSGYHGLHDITVNFTAPIFFSETGCNVPLGRNFADQTAILSNMSDTWSGAIVYVWGQTAALYGLVTYGGDTSAYDKDQTEFGDSGTPTPIVPDFNNLVTQWATLHPTGISASAYTPTLAPPKCPEYAPGVWEVDPSGPIPTLGLDVVIPTSSALAMANGGLPNYTTPILRVPATPVTTASNSGTFLQERHYRSHPASLSSPKP